jgi:hypothetical protein
MSPTKKTRSGSFLLVLEFRFAKLQWERDFRGESNRSISEEISNAAALQ